MARLGRAVRRPVMVLLMLGAAWGCGDSGVDPSPPLPPPPQGAISSFQGVQSIFTRSCAFSSCHSGPAPRAGLDLGPDRFRGNIVRVASTQVPGLFRVDPGRPDSSYLVLKLEGLAGAVGGIGTQMPLGGQLTRAQIDSVRAWVAAGAPDH